MVGKAFKFFTMFGFSLVLIGELDFRLLSHDQRLEYEVDHDLYWRLRPNQKGFEWLANMSKKSPPITINSAGFRNEEFEFVYPGDPVKVLAIGSSFALGVGVGDREVWTSQLEEMSNQKGKKLVVLNAGNPGWGPFQHSKFFEREANNRNVGATVVMVSGGDLNFLPFDNAEDKEEYIKKSMLKKKLASVSPFLTYSYRKLETHFGRIKGKIAAMFELSSTDQVVAQKDKGLDQGLPINLEKQKQYWSNMADLALEYKKPLIFLVLRPDSKAVTNRIRMIVSDITATNPYTKIVEVDTTHRNKEELIIAGDGHPNAEYHQIIAKAVLGPLKSFLNTAPLQSAMAK